MLDILRAAQEEHSRDDSARDPPRRDADQCVVRGEVLPGRSQHLLRFLEHLRPHHHVLVLPLRCPRTPVPEVPLVEKVPHHSTDGEFVHFTVIDN